MVFSLLSSPNHIAIKYKGLIKTHLPYLIYSFLESYCGSWFEAHAIYNNDLQLKAQQSHPLQETTVPYNLHLQN